MAVAYAKDNDKLVILGGSMGTTMLDANGVKAVAELPSLDELRGKIVGLLLAPATKTRRRHPGPGRSACPRHRRVFQEGSRVKRDTTTFKPVTNRRN